MLIWLIYVPYFNNIFFSIIRNFENIFIFIKNVNLPICTSCSCGLINAAYEDEEIYFTLGWEIHDAVSSIGESVAVTDGFSAHFYHWSNLWFLFSFFFFMANLCRRVSHQQPSPSFLRPHKPKPRQNAN